VADGDRHPQRADVTALNRRAYDRIASRYAERQRQRQPADGRWFPDIEDRFLAGVPAGGLLADLGCGPGFDGARFTTAGFQVLAMDLSAGMLEVAARSLAGRVAQADLRALPIAAGCLDGIWCSAALLHVPDDDTARVLQEFRRTLRRSGTLALVTAVGDSSRFEAVPYARGEERWFVYRDTDRLRQQLSEAGFIVQIEREVAGNRRWMTLLASAV
jgi:SAM-dependent methyltransferase